MTTAIFKAYGDLIHSWRNEIKFSREMVSEDLNIPVERIISLEEGLEKPTWTELEKLSKEFRISIISLLTQLTTIA